MIYWPLVLTGLILIPDSSTTQAHQMDGLCLSPSRLYPELNDCRKFIRCVNRKPVVFSCPAKTTFDPETQICTWRSDLDDCHKEDNVVTAGGTSVQDGGTAKGAVDHVTVKSVITDVERSTQTVTTAEALASQGSTAPLTVVTDKTTDTLTETDTLTDIDKLTEPYIEDTSNDFWSIILNSAANGKVTVSDSTLAKTDNRQHQDEFEDAFLNLPDTISDRTSAPTDQATSRQRATGNMTDATPNTDQLKFDDLLIKKYIPRSDTRSTQTNALLNRQETTATDVTSQHEATTISNNTTAPTKVANTTVSSNAITDATDSPSSTQSDQSFHTQPISSDRPIENYQRKDKDIVNRLDWLKTSTSLAGHSTEGDSGFTNQETNSSLNEGPQSRAHPTTLPATSIPSLDETSLETDTSKSHFSSIAPPDSNRLNDTVNTNIDASDNKEGIPRENPIVVEGPGELHKPLQQNDDQAQPPIIDVTSLSRDSMLLQEAPESDGPYRQPNSQQQSDKRGARTDQEALPTQPHHPNNVEETAALSSDNLLVPPESGHLFLPETTIGDDLDQIHEDRHSVYSHAPSSVDNIRVPSDSTSLSPPSRSLEAEPSTPNLMEAEDSSERPLMSPYKALGSFSEDNRSKSAMSMTLKGQIPTSDPTTLSTIPSTVYLESTQRDVGVAQMYDATTPFTTWLPDKTERKVNISFKSVPYRVKGLVRSFRCPLPDGHFLDPHNCSVHYHCSGDQAYRRDCPSGQVFHLTVLACVSASLAPPCPTPADSRDQQAPAEDPYQCERDGHFRDPTHCDVYYICSAGNSMRMTCDPGTSFDATLNLCMWNSDVLDCVDTKVASRDLPRKDNFAFRKAKEQFLKLEPPGEKTLLIHNDYVCPEPDGVFPDPNNCSVYHVCARGRANRQVCPGGDGYDVAEGACVESWRLIRCVVGSNYEETMAPSASSEQSTSFICPEAHGLYPDPDNCSVFIHCFKKVPYRHKCQPDTVFNSETGVCTWRELVPECQADGVKLPSPAEPQPPSPAEPQPPNSAASSSQSVEWSQKAHIVPFKPFLSGNESPEPTAPGPPVDLEDFTCPDVADGFFRDNLFCDIFHRCVFRTRFTFTCPTGTFFRLRGNMCDFWETVTDCTKDGLRRDAMRSLPEFSQLPVTPPAPSDLDLSNSILDADPAPCPESSGLFPHPRNCRQFLFCAHSVPLVLTCPESLLYNPQTLTCDLSKNVRCLRYDDYARK